MKHIQFDDAKIHVKSWCESLDDGTLNQVHNLARLPFAHHHIALMPDAHVGYGMPIGGVLATRGVVIPNAVGVDIGCGMIAAMVHGVTAEDLDPETRKAILAEIRKRVPLGRNHHEESQPSWAMPLPPADEKHSPIVHREYQSATRQVGTLGGGNHFIEIQEDLEGKVWVMIHSGSRNVGKQVADFYNKLAISENDHWHAGIPQEWQLAFLPFLSEFGQQYLYEMQWCVEFAKANRWLMMTRIEEAFNAALSPRAIVFDQQPIDVCHNYAKMEFHYGMNVVVHRKGATFAGSEVTGIIPGSQGTASYITNGLGNPESFRSSSHGAGRKMGRKDAARNLNLDAELKKMADQGIVHGMRNQDDLDEAPGAYKDIDEVMEAQKDLVDRVVKLRPLAVLKGD